MSAAFHALKVSFNGGEMSPLLDTRVDAEKQQTGCQVMQNFIPRVHGGVFKRPGTELVGEAYNQNSRLHGFKRSTSVNYVLEFGSTVYVTTVPGIRFWKGGTTATQVQAPTPSAWVTGTGYKNGDYVTESGDTYYCLVDHASGIFADDRDVSGYWNLQTAYEIPSPYDEADIFSLQFCQLNDILFIVHPSYEPRSLTFRSETDWLLEKVPFDYAPALDLNETTGTLQIQYNVNDWATATNYPVGSRVIGTDGNIYTCYSSHVSAAGTAPITGASYLTRWNLGTSSDTIPLWANSTAYVVGNLVRRNKTIYECISNHTSNVPIKGVDGWIGGTRPGSSQNWTRVWKISGGVFDLNDVGLRLQATGDTFVASDVGTVWRATFGIDNGFRRLSLASTGLIDPTDSLFIQGGYTITTNWNSGSAVIGTLIVEESADNKAWRQIKIFEINDATEGNIAYTGDAGSVGVYIRISADIATARAGKSMYLEPASALLTLPIRIDGYTSAKQVTCSAIMPGDQLVTLNVIGVATTSWRKPAFSATQGYPKAIAFHDSRLWYGGTPSQPGRIWASQTDDFYNFLTGTDDTDGLDITLASVEANAIQWVASFNRQLVVATTGDEWTIDSGDTDGALTPTSFRVRRRTRYGAQDIAPQLTGDSLLWVQRGGQKLREFAYVFESDSFTAPDMTVFAEHLWRGSQIIQTAFMATPEPVFIACDSTDLYLFFYDRQQQFTAWCKFTGVFNSVATIYGETVDEVWVNQSGFICRFHPKTWAHYIAGKKDSTYSLRGGGLFYDLGKESVGVYDSLSGNTDFSGYAIINALVSGGIRNGIVSALPYACTSSGDNIRVGGNFNGRFGYFGARRYNATLVSNRLDAMMPTGTSMARKWRLNRVAFVMLDSYSEFQFTDNETFSFDDSVEFTVDTPTLSNFGKVVYLTDIPFNGSWKDRMRLSVISPAGDNTADNRKGGRPFGLLAAILKVEVSGE